MSYSPNPPPQDPSDFIAYLYQELLQIAGEFNKVEEGQFLKTWTVAPTKPREGMLVIAAGAPAWNPGSGKGLYEFRSGAWVKL